MGNRLGLVFHWLFSVSAVLLIVFGVLTHSRGERLPNLRYNLAICKAEVISLSCGKTVCKGCAKFDEIRNANWAILIGVATTPIFAVILFVIYGRWIWFPWQHDD